MHLLSRVRDGPSRQRQLYRGDSRHACGAAGNRQTVETASVAAFAAFVIGTMSGRSLDLYLRLRAPTFDPGLSVLPNDILTRADGARIRIGRTC